MFSFLEKFSISLGNWFGVPAKIHWSWVLLFLFVLFKYGWVAAVSYAGLIFIVLLHECGHCLAGKYYGCYIQDIVLYPFGGVASMQIPSKAKEEFVIAIAGPFVNVLLIPILWALTNVHEILHNLAIYNIVLLCFNLLPAFPMDGGRVFRAVLSWAMNNRVRATTIAVRVGQGFALLFGLVGIFVANPLLLFIGFMIFVAAEDELRAAKLMGTGVHESAQILENARSRISELNRKRDEL